MSQGASEVRAGVGEAVGRGRPHRSPTKVADDVEEFLVGARKARSKLAELPAQSTIGEALRRRGLTVPRRLKRARATQAATQPFAEVTGPNATWCVDFKGHFRTHDGRVCYPLTIIDAHSRFLIRCEGVEDPNGREVQRIFEPGKPQQNGRQERFHRTLKAETAAPPRADMRAQQRAFDLFRKTYNEERPHEALGQKPPATCFALSARRYPCPLVRFATESPWEHVERIDKDGFIRWHDQRIFVSRALAHEDVALEYSSDAP